MPPAPPGLPGPGPDPGRRRRSTGPPHVAEKTEAPSDASPCTLAGTGDEVLVAGCDSFRSREDLPRLGLEETVPRGRLWDMHVVDHEEEMSIEPCLRAPGSARRPEESARSDSPASVSGPRPPSMARKSSGERSGTLSRSLSRIPRARTDSEVSTGVTVCQTAGSPPEPLQQQRGLPGPGTTGDDGEATGRSFIEKGFEPRLAEVIGPRMRAAPGQMASCVVRWPYFYPIATGSTAP